MPNWCSCNLSVRGSHDDIARFVAIGVYATIPDENNGLIHKYPKTEMIQVWNLSRYYNCPDAYESSAEQHRAKALGAEQRREWNIKHWGTKWDCYATSDSFRITATSFDAQFDTAWSPPVAWLRKVQRIFPNLLFRLDYIEEGMWFAGLAYTHRETQMIIDNEAVPWFREIRNDRNIFRANEVENTQAGEYINQNGEIRTSDDLCGDANFEIISPFESFRADWEQDEARYTKI